MWLQQLSRSGFQPCNYFAGICCLGENVFSLDSIDDRPRCVWWTRVHGRAYTSGPQLCGQHWVHAGTTQTSREETWLPEQLVSQTTWLHRTLKSAQILPVLPQDEFILVVSSPVDGLHQSNQQQQLQATSRLCVGTEGLGSDTLHREETGKV